MRICWIGASLFVAAFGAAGQPAPAVPPELVPPAEAQLILKAHASGVQIYECKMSASDPATFAWTFSGPEAKLTDDAGKTVATHFAGPTWQATDGSQVKGKVMAQATPDSASIPWLLLSSASHQGDGVMQKVLFIQRLHTTGGKAPPGGCDGAHTGEKARVDYTADYFFYGH